MTCEERDIPIPVTGFFQGVRRLVGFSRKERRLFLESLLWGGLFRLIILLVPFRRIAPRLGVHMVETPSDELSPERLLLAREVAIAIGRASRHVPWEAKCLVQAMTGKKMLRRRGIETTLYLGVAKKDGEGKEGLQAHAWLRCGDKVILGGGGLKAFTVVSTFGGKTHGSRK